MATKKENLQLWSKVEKSDPNSIREVVFGQRKFHTIDAHSQIKKATEIFGIFGIDWGVNDIAYSVLGTTLLLYQGELWFNHEEKKGIIPLASSIFIVSPKGKVDEECVKKVQTDAITKALSRLGFNSDVFENKFADARYVSERQTEVSEEKTKEEEDKVDKLILDLMPQVNKAVEDKDGDTLAAIWQKNVKLQQNVKFIELIRAANQKLKNGK